MRDISALKHKQEEIHLTILQSYIHNFCECMSVQSPSPVSYERQVTLSYQFMNGHKQGGLEGGKNRLCIKLKFKIKVYQSKFF